MTQQQHHDETLLERFGPSERYEEDRDVQPTRERVVTRSRGGGTFYGWLVAIGLTALLTAIAGAIAAAVDYAVTFDWSSAKSDTDTAGTIGIVSGAILLLILAIAYYHGGYVAGRLAGYAGTLHGFGVWLIGVVVTALVAGLAALAGSQYDVLDRMDLPSVPIGDQTLTTGGLVAAAAALVVTLIAAMAGGRSGQRHDRGIDDGD